MTRSHAKGAAGELEVVKLYREVGFDAFRVPMSGGHANLPGDLGGVPFIHGEIKRAERLKLPEWRRQCERDCPPELLPVLHYRQNRTDWRVDIDAARWARFLAVVLQLDP